jgi:hypothetical protein
MNQSDAKRSYSQLYYQKNKSKFRQYYLNYKHKKKQIADGTYVEPVKEEKPKKTKYQIINNKFNKQQQKYLENREKWLQQNNLLSS